MTGEYTQGIDIGFAFDLPPSRVSDCMVTGGQEGIVSHMAHVDFRDNHVSQTTFARHRRHGDVDGQGLAERRRGPVGVGIYCGDYSECEITRNSVGRIRPDLESDDRLAHGLAILSHFHAQAQVSDNGVVDSPGGVRASGATIEHDD